MVPNNFLCFLKNILSLVIVIFFLTGEGFSKRPHLGSPGKAMKNGIGKAGKAVGGSLKIVDKVLKKAGLPRANDLKSTLKWIVPTLKDINALRKKPRNTTLLKKLRQSTCIKKLQVLDDKCQKPAIFMASMIPNVGGTISYACGQVGSINSRLAAAFDKAEQAQAMAQNPQKVVDDQLLQTMDEPEEDIPDDPEESEDAEEAE